MLTSSARGRRCDGARAWWKIGLSFSVSGAPNTTPGLGRTTRVSISAMRRRTIFSRTPRIWWRPLSFTVTKAPTSPASGSAK